MKKDLVKAKIEKIRSRSKRLAAEWMGGEAKERAREHAQEQSRPHQNIRPKRPAA
jgi:hypothetical protein